MTVQSIVSNESLKPFKSNVQFGIKRMEALRRLASFETWPVGDTPSPLSFARSGFTYSGENYKVFCPLCRIELDNLKRGDDPAEEHRKRSPDCSFAHQVTAVSNSPPPVISPSSNGSQALLDVLASATRRLHSTDRDPEVVEPNASLSLSVRVDRLNPDYELLRRETIRLDTYYDWPLSAHAVPESLAREGFFYTGSTDRVRCAFCHSTLHSWVPGDDPKEEHQKHYPRCPFVLNLDVGNVPIENAVPLRNSGQDLPSLTSTVTMMGASTGQTSTEPPSLEASMRTATVRAALEMGFLEESVRQVVEQRLGETGQLFPSAESLVEQLLSLGVSQSYIAAGAQMNTSSATSPSPSSVNLAFPASTSSASTSSTGASPTVSSSSSSASVASLPAFLCASSSMAAATSSIADFSSAVTTNEEKGIPHNAKKGNGSTKRRKRGLRKEKSSASSLVGPSDIGAVFGETSSGSTTASANSPVNENSGLVVDPEENQLLEENSRLKEARTCKVCMDKEVNTVFLPCGHLICCDICSPQVRNCPLCRTFIRGTVKTYLA